LGAPDAPSRGIIVPKKSFAIEAGGEKRLEISWEGMYRDVKVSLDGNSIGVIHERKALVAGEEFALPDGSILKIQLVRVFIERELHLLRNGQPLPGSASDPQTRLKNAYHIIFEAAGVFIISSLPAILFRFRILPLIGNGFVLGMILGLVLIPLGFFVRQKSVIALSLAIAVVSGVGILGLYLFLLGSISIVGAVTSIYLTLCFLGPMFPGFGAIKVLSNKYA
jgi:hypothetical protein